MFDLLHRQIGEGFEDLRAHLDVRLNVISRQVLNVSQGIIKMALNFDALKGLVQTVSDNQAQLASDQAKNSADIVAAIAKLATVTPTDPADQATIDSVSATLQTIANSQKASSTALEQSSADLEKATA